MTKQAFQSEFYKTLFELSFDMLCVANLDGYFELVNPAMCHGLGYSEDELYARPFIELLHPDDLEATKQALSDLGNGRFVIGFENRYRHANGSYRALEWSSRVDPYTGKIFAAVKDQTEYKRAQNRVKQIERILDSETIMVQTDKDGVITYANQNFSEISGYTSQELVGQTHRIVNSGKHPKVFFQNLWQRLQTGKRWVGLIENRNKNGELYSVQSIIAPIFDIENQQESYLAIQFDVSEAVQTKKDHEKTLSILNETSRIAKVGGWELDVASGELTWTDETFRILEVEKKDEQKPILPEGLSLFIDEHKPIIDEAVQRAISAGEPYSLELQAKTAKGNILWVYTNGKPNYKDSQIVSISGTIQDIDQRKRAEFLYEQERYKSHQNAKLASLGQLSAGVAHEINNPLAIIQSSANQIHKFIDHPSKLRSKIDAISHSCDRISHITKSLQKFSRSNAGAKFSLHCLADIVEEATKLTEIQARRYQIPINLHLHTTKKISCVDLDIEQVIINLINNAIFEIKDKDERWIRICLEERDEHLELSITDSGPGIPKELRDKLFEPFFTTKPTGEGTGLGLAITQGILEDHRASIALDPQSKNTRFILCFPHQMEP